MGLAAALLSVSFARLGNGAWGLVQIAVIVMTLAVFFLNEKYLAALTVGLGVGLDTMSSYPFFVWTAIVTATVITGWWLSKTVLTNRSLPSLILLGIGMRVSYFIFELSFSRASQIFGGSAWYLVSDINISGVLIACGIELCALFVAFMIYVRVRGEHSRMLTHL